MLFHESEEEKSVKRSRKLKWNRHKGKYYTDFNYVTALKKMKTIHSKLRSRKNDTMLCLIFCFVYAYI